MLCTECYYYCCSHQTGYCATFTQICDYDRKYQIGTQPKGGMIGGIIAGVIVLIIIIAIFVWCKKRQSANQMAQMQAINNANQGSGDTTIILGNTQPVYGQPMYNQPMMQQPYGQQQQPQYGQPVYGQQPGYYQNQQAPIIIQG